MPSPSLLAPGGTLTPARRRDTTLHAGPSLPAPGGTLTHACRRDTNTWERHGNVRFNWSGICPSTGSQQFVRVLVELGSDQGGGGSSQVGMAALMNPTPNLSARSTHIALPLSGSVSRTEYLAVHEFGHVLGFGHEQDRGDNTSTSHPVCNPAGSITGNNFSSYDPESVMHYCNSGGNNSGRLSQRDIYGVVVAYGGKRGGMILSDTNSGLAVNAYPRYSDSQQR